jgi:hypothetical protein
MRQRHAAVSHEYFNVEKQLHHFRRLQTLPDLFQIPTSLILTYESVRNGTPHGVKQLVSKKKMNED